MEAIKERVSFSDDELDKFRGVFKAMQNEDGWVRFSKIIQISNLVFGGIFKSEIKFITPKFTAVELIDDIGSIVNKEKNITIGEVIDSLVANGTLFIKRVEIIATDKLGNDPKPVKIRAFFLRPL